MCDERRGGGAHTLAAASTAPPSGARRPGEARRGGGPCVSVTGAMVQMSHILTAAEGELGAPMRHAHGRHQAYEELDGAEIHVTLDDRELWTKFQCLTNEMIVTKNGRYAKTQRRQAYFEKKKCCNALIPRKNEESCF